MASQSQSGAQPRFLGRYELMYLLGQGGMGEVHLARLTGAAGFEKLCIVKTILPQMMTDPQFVDRFIRHGADRANRASIDDRFGRRFEDFERALKYGLRALEINPNMEGVRQVVAHASDCDVSFLHGLQQRRLGSGAGAVNFIGHEKLREYRSADEAESALATVVFFEDF